MDERIKIATRIHPAILDELMMKYGEKDGRKLNAYEGTLVASTLRAKRGEAEVDIAVSSRGKHARP